MNTKNKLSIGMGLLFLFTFLSFGTIILNQKSKLIVIPKIEDKINSYLKREYKSIYNDLKHSDIKYEISQDYYYTKIYNKKNKNLYFTIKYKKNIITDTYKKDYLEGDTLLNYYQEKFTKDLNEYDIKIRYSKKLNKYSKLVQENLIEKNNIKQLAIYSISCDIVTKNFNKKGISDNINKFYNYVNKKGYNPKSYSFVITNKKDITQAVEIKNLDEDIIKNNLDEIISAIIDRKNVSNKYNVTYKYLN